MSILDGIIDQLIGLHHGLRYNGLVTTWSAEGGGPPPKKSTLVPP